MMQKTARIATMIEPEIEDMFRRLADKKGLTCSGLMRSLIIDELQMQGFLPEAVLTSLLKKGVKA